MSNIPDAYFAGLFDGEGSISITAQHTKNGEYHRLVVSIQMIDEEVIYAFLEHFGGCVYKLGPYKENKQPYFQWQIQGEDITNFLTVIQPYSISKREHIKLALEFTKTISRNHPRKGNAFANSGIPEIRAELCLKMRQLNIKSPYKEKS